MQSSHPSCLSMREISFSLKREDSCLTGFTSVESPAKDVSIGSRSRVPTSRGVPKWGQELATQWTAEPSLDATSKRSIPPAVTGTISPGDIRVFGATTIHSSFFFESVSNKTPDTNFWAALTALLNRSDLLVPLLPTLFFLAVSSAIFLSSRSLRFVSSSFCVAILRSVSLSSDTRTSGDGFFWLPSRCRFRSSSRILTAWRNSSASFSACLCRSCTCNRSSSPSFRIWRSSK
mmetsp:Transcript_26853/g.58925  ORF Transcript_26853/g.58925 Transcript_26853/m.58925 type:complete len:233 (-) Transcript_26853:1238-1936(-)